MPAPSALSGAPSLRSSSMRCLAISAPFGAACSGAFSSAAGSATAATSVAFSLLLVFTLAVAIDFGSRPCRASCTRLGLRIFAIAEAVVELVADGRDVTHVVARGGRPLLGDEREGHRPVDRLLPIGQHAPLLHLARAFGDRVVDVLAGVHHQMLKVRFDAGRDVGEAFAACPAAGGAETGKVVLRGSARRHRTAGRPSRGSSGRRRCPSEGRALRRGACTAWRRPQSVDRGSGCATAGRPSGVPA